MKILKLSWWAGWWNRAWFEWHWFRTDKENVPTESQLWSEKEVFQSGPVVRLRKSYSEVVTGAEAPAYGRGLDISEADNPPAEAIPPYADYLNLSNLIVQKPAKKSPAKTKKKTVKKGKSRAKKG